MTHVISSGTLRSAIEYGLPLPLLWNRCNQTAILGLKTVHAVVFLRSSLNQLRTEPWIPYSFWNVFIEPVWWIPNQDERRVIKMSWSTVSKAAWYVLWSYCTDAVIVDVQKSCFGRIMFALGWLVFFEKTCYIPSMSVDSSRRYWKISVNIFWWKCYGIVTAVWYKWNSVFSCRLYHAIRYEMLF